MKIIENIKETFRILKRIRTGVIDVAWLKIVEALMEFAVDVQQNGKPMLTRIAVVDMSKIKVIGDFDVVSIWAAVGDANPIERCRQLKEQNSALKELLVKCRQELKSGDNDLITNIQLVLDTFG